MPVVLATFVGVLKLGIANLRRVTLDNRLDEVSLEKEPVELEGVLR